MTIVPMTNRLTCPEVSALFDAYLDDDALPPIRRQGMDAHLAVCEGCRRALSCLRRTRRLLRSLPGEPMPSAMKQHLLDTLRSRSHEPRILPPN